MMLTAKQVAEMLGVSVRQIYDLAASGKLPAYRFGRSLRFAPSDVETFVIACRVVRSPTLTSKQAPCAIWMKSPPADGESELQKQFRALGIKALTRR